MPAAPDAADHTALSARLSDSEGVQAPRGELKPMLTYYYALISGPCARTVDELLEYARAHPGCLLTLPPAYSRAMHRAIAVAWGDTPESEQFTLAIERRTLN
jgi:hypothetical protein